MILGFFPRTSDEEYRVHQPKSSVSDIAGDDVTLSFNMSAVSAKRTSSWFKEAGAEQQLIYSFSGNYFP
jgi:hypothetical protein